MNRKQKIILSVTGIFLVLLLLVGLTYAYFLTRINGNTNTKSISVSTANLALVYGDDDGSIIGEGETIIPGTTFDVKTFTVTNQGNAKTDYVVVIEDVSVTYAETIEVDGVTQTAGNTTTFQSNDFVYTLTCTSGCNGVNKETTFPINDGILVGNSIDVAETQTYAFTLTYKETGIVQSADMNKTLNAKLNIKDISTINPYSDNTSSLAYNIINNAIIGATGTTLASVPETKVAEEISWGPIETGKYGLAAMPEEMMPYGFNPWLYADTEAGASGGSSANGKSCSELVGKYIYDQSSKFSGVLKVESCEGEVPVVNQEIMAYEKTLSVAQDDLGTSYYYRGDVEDNYVTFANMCWRIVRINGDGSTKLILEDKDEVCSTTIDGNWDIEEGNYGYDSSSQSTSGNTLYKMNYLNPVTNNTSSMVKAFYDFQNTKLADYTGKLKSGDWCLGDKAYTRSGSSGSYTYTLLEDTTSNYLSETSFVYDAYTRLTNGNANGYQPTLKCNGTILNEFADVSGVSSKSPMYVGTITADEIVYAGGKYNVSNFNYYLINRRHQIDLMWFRSLSPSDFSGNNGYTFNVSSSGALYNDVPSAKESSGIAIRPSVSLASSAEISEGVGTLESPYVIG